MYLQDAGTSPENILRAVSFWNDNFNADKFNFMCQKTNVKDCKVFDQKPKPVSKTCQKVAEPKAVCHKGII